ncbi:MAG: RdgB/HAM1 family non-canonical purine NTP pyrophosphatase [Bacilli bacterium]|jgi:XTP/dITP diphosphohydrolase
MKIIVASNNEHKIAEYRELFSSLSIQIVSMSEANIKCEVEETGDSYEKNAALKAEAIKDQTKQLVIADDSGLEIEALDDFPGLYSARFALEQGGSEKANSKVLDLLQNETNRKARFVATIALCNLKAETLVFRGECQGLISQESIGRGGFGYDPIFFSLEANASFSTLTSEEKNRFSHRGKAVASLIAYLKSENVI